MIVDPATIVPRPRHVQTNPGHFRVPRRLAVTGSDAGRTALEPFLRALRESGALDVIVESADGADLRIREQTEDGEGYTVSVAPDGIEVTGGASGLRHAAQTLIGLVAPEALLPGSGVGAMLACCRIEDAPAFPWRGLMIDVARHFQPVSWLRRLVRIAAFHKLNVVHLHLTDDQGWRMPIDRFPRLTEIGGQRRETLVGQAPGSVFDGVAHGGSYTKAELRALVRYAASYGITVVPEIDLPGHMVAAIAAYPSWGNADKPLDVLTTWGISEDVINTRPETIAALKAILDEVMDVFPSPCIHLGGDEAPSRDWEDSAEVAELIARENLPSVRAVQGWLMDQLVTHVRDAGRTAIAWDEAAEAGVASDVIIQGWRSPERVTQALAGGYRTIASPQQHYYLDYQYSLDDGEPQGIGRKRAAFTDLAALLEYDLPSGILGVEAALWTEYVKTPQRAEYQLLPRLAGVAEVGWRGRRVPAQEFAAVAAAQERRYAALGWDHRPLAGPGQRWSTTAVGE